MTEQTPLTETTIIEALNRAGFRQTRQRKALAEQVARMASSDTDFAIEDLWHDTRACDAGIGRATAFRTVEVLVELGLLDRVAFADGSERYHAVHPGAHHHHLTCERCHKIVEVDACLESTQLDEVARRSGFSLVGHRIEIFGRCPDCQALA